MPEKARTLACLEDILLSDSKGAREGHALLQYPPFVRVPGA